MCDARTASPRLQYRAVVPQAAFGFVVAFYWSACNVVALIYFEREPRKKHP